MKYDRPVWQLMHACADAMPEIFRYDDVRAWFAQNYPEVGDATLRAHVVGLTEGGTKHAQFRRRSPIFRRVARGEYEPIAFEERGELPEDTDDDQTSQAVRFQAAGADPVDPPDAPPSAPQRESAADIAWWLADPEDLEAEFGPEERAAARSEVEVSEDDPIDDEPDDATHDEPADDDVLVQDESGAQDEGSEPDPDPEIEAEPPVQDEPVVDERTAEDFWPFPAQDVRADEADDVDPDDDDELPPAAPVEDIDVEGAEAFWPFPTSVPETTDPHARNDRRRRTFTRRDARRRSLADLEQARMQAVEPDDLGAGPERVPEPLLDEAPHEPRGEQTEVEATDPEAEQRDERERLERELAERELAESLRLAEQERATEQARIVEEQAEALRLQSERALAAEAETQVERRRVSSLRKTARKERERADRLEQERRDRKARRRAERKAREGAEQNLREAAERRRLEEEEREMSAGVDPERLAFEQGEADRLAFEAAQRQQREREAAEAEQLAAEERQLRQTLHPLEDDEPGPSGPCEPADASASAHPSVHGGIVIVRAPRRPDDAAPTGADSPSVAPDHARSDETGPDETGPDETGPDETVLDRDESDQGAVAGAEQDDHDGAEGAATADVLDPEAEMVDAIVLGSLGERLAVPAPARDAFRDIEFQRARRAAEISGARWFVLSADHGLLEPLDWMSPDDSFDGETDPRHRAAWATWVVARLEALVGALDDLVVQVEAPDDMRLPVISALLDAGAAATTGPVHAPAPDLEPEIELPEDLDDPIDEDDEPADVRDEAPEEPRSAQVIPFARSASAAEHLADVRFAVDSPDAATLPHQPGLYAWSVDHAGARMLNRALRLPVRAGVIFVGQVGAGQGFGEFGFSLHDHVTRVQLHGRSRASTFRMTLATTLAGALGLHTMDDPRLTHWMLAHLSVSVWPTEDLDGLGALKESVISTLRPTLNVDRVDAPEYRRRLTELRADLA